MHWKLIVEAFLDAYHIRILRRDTIHRFFIDASSISERVGRHIRAVSARRTLREAPPELPADGNLRALGTASHLVAPATIVIVHPDSVSVQTLHRGRPARPTMSTSCWSRPIGSTTRCTGTRPGR